MVILEPLWLKGYLISYSSPLILLFINFSNFFYCWLSFCLASDIIDCLKSIIDLSCKFLFIYSISGFILNDAPNLSSYEIESLLLLILSIFDFAIFASFFLFIQFDSWDLYVTFSIDYWILNSFDLYWDYL